MPQWTLQESVSCYSAEAAAAAVAEFLPAESAPTIRLLGTEHIPVMFPQVPSPVAVLDHPPGQADKSMFVHLLSGLSEVAAHLAGGQSVVVHLHCSLAVPTGNIMESCTSCNFTFQTVLFSHLYLGNLGSALNLNLIRGLGHVLHYYLLAIGRLDDLLPLGGRDHLAGSPKICINIRMLVCKL